MKPSPFIVLLLRGLAVSLLVTGISLTSRNIKEPNFFKPCERHCMRYVYVLLFSAVVDDIVMLEV